MSFPPARVKYKAHSEPSDVSSVVLPVVLAVVLAVVLLVVLAVVLLVVLAVVLLVESDAFKRSLSQVQSQVREYKS